MMTQVKLLFPSSPSFCTCLMVSSVHRFDPSLDFVVGAAHSRSFQLSTPTSTSDPGAAIQSAQRGHHRTRCSEVFCTAAFTALLASY